MHAYVLFFHRKQSGRNVSAKINARAITLEQDAAQRSALTHISYLCEDKYAFRCTETGEDRAERGEEEVISMDRGNYLNVLMAYRTHTHQYASQTE